MNCEFSPFLSFLLPPTAVATRGQIKLNTSTTLTQRPAAVADPPATPHVVSVLGSSQYGSAVPRKSCSAMKRRISGTSSGGK